MNGTEGAVCSLNGLPCPCKENYVGRRCDMCESGFYNFPDCIRKYTELYISHIERIYRAFGRSVRVLISVLC